MGIYLFCRQSGLLDNYQSAIGQVAHIQIAFKVDFLLLVRYFERIGPAQKWPWAFLCVHAIKRSRRMGEAAATHETCRFKSAAITRIEGNGQRQFTGRDPSTAESQIFSRQTDRQRLSDEQA